MAFFPSIDTAKEITLTTNIQLDYPYSANLANVTVADMMDVKATIGNLNIFWLCPIDCVNSHKL